MAAPGAGLPNPPPQRVADALQLALDALRQGELTAAAFAAQARSAQALLEALPARYGQVWLDLIDRLESAALFTEESCSFSPADRAAALQQWLDQARSRLGAGGTSAGGTTPSA